MAEGAQLRIHRGSRTPIEVDVGGRAEIVLVPRELPVLELGDINFGLDRAVLLPPLSEDELARTSGKADETGETGETDESAASPVPENRALMAEAVFARAFAFVRENPHRCVCIAGHTDASGSGSHNDTLSENRALSVALYLKAGSREAWANTCSRTPSPTTTNTR